MLKCFEAMGDFLELEGEDINPCSEVMIQRGMYPIHIRPAQASLACRGLFLFFSFLEGGIEFIFHHLPPFIVTDVHK